MKWLLVIPFFWIKEHTNQLLMKGDILHYCQEYLNQVEENNTLMTDSFHSMILEYEDFKDLVLQAGNFVYRKKFQRPVPGQDVEK